MKSETDTGESKLVADVRDAANQVRELGRRIKVLREEATEAEDRYLDALDRLNEGADVLPTESLTIALSRRRERLGDA